MSANFLMPVNEIDVHQLSSVIRNRVENVLIIDSRSFTDHNACHISSSVNVSCSKVVKRRLQQDKLSVKELLIHTCNCDVDEKLDVIVYDQSTKDSNSLSPDSFIVIFLKKLQLTFRSVNLLSGGFEEFRKCYADLCEDKPKKCPPLTSLSQPCLPITNQGPTRILPFLYLGSQFDAMNKELLKDCNITYALNVSTTCPQPDFLAEGHFMRIPVNDTYSEKLLPYFPQAFNFLDKVREGNSCVLVHCLAGVSRSPTVAVAYVMRYLRLSSDDGYRYVKSKRPTISPNFNFLGQLLEYEKQLKVENILEPKSDFKLSLPMCGKKRLCRTDMRQLALSLDLDSKETENPIAFLQPKKEDQSPTTALAKLSFDVPNHAEKEPTLPDFRQFRSKSCYGDWLRSYEDAGTERKGKEGGVSAKILSPVKEIKCDGLISEISTGNSEMHTKCKGLIRQRNNSFQYSREEKRSNNVQKYSKYETHSNTNKGSFSLVTLTHLSPSSNSKTHKKSENISQNKKRFNLSIFDSQRQKWHANEKKEMKYNFHFTEKLTRHTSLVRSNENLPQTDDFDQKLINSSFHINPPFSHSLSLNSDLHKLSDSFGTSRLFVNENSEYNHKKSRNFNLLLENEDTKNKAIFSNKVLASNLESFMVSEDKNWIQNPGNPLNISDDHLAKDSLGANVEIFNNNTDKN